MPATPAAQLLHSLDLITAEIVSMLEVLDTARNLTPMIVGKRNGA